MFPVPYWVGVGGGEWEMPVGREVNSVERALSQDLRAPNSGLCPAALLTGPRLVSVLLALK